MHLSPGPGVLHGSPYWLDVEGAFTSAEGPDLETTPHYFARVALTTGSRANKANPSKDVCWVGSVDGSQTHHVQRANANRALIDCYQLMGKTGQNGADSST